MRRLVTGVVVAAMLAASQAGATASGVVTSADRAAPAQGASDQMMGGEFGAGWLVVALGIIVVVAAVIDGNNRHDRPSSP
jgi:hypothetical protein